MSIEHTRGLNFFNPKSFSADERRIEIIGAGGIGSPLSEALAVMGFDIVIWDNDVVESHNIYSQNYYPDQVGMVKTAALLETLCRKVANPTDAVEKDMGKDVQVIKIRDKDDPNFIQTFVGKSRRISGKDELLGDIVVLATDNIESRSFTFENALRSYKKYGLPRVLIDARLGGEYFQTFYVDLADSESVKAYQRTLFDPSEAVDLPCTGKSIMYIANMVSGQIAYYVKEAVIKSGRKHREAIYDFIEQINVFNGCIVSFSGEQ